MLQRFLTDETVSDELRIVLGRAGSIEEARKLLESSNYDVILLDLNLPDSWQFEGLKKLVSDYPNTPIIVVTSSMDEVYNRKAIQGGAEDCLDKSNLSRDSIIRTIVHSIERFSKRALNGSEGLLNDVENLRELRKLVSKGRVA